MGDPPPGALVGSGLREEGVEKRLRHTVLTEGNQREKLCDGRAARGDFAVPKFDHRGLVAVRARVSSLKVCSADGDVLKSASARARRGAADDRVDERALARCDFKTFVERTIRCAATGHEGGQYERGSDVAMHRGVDGTRTKRG